MLAPMESVSATFALTDRFNGGERSDRGAAAGAASYLQNVADMYQVLATMKEAATGEGRLPTPVARRAVDGIGSGVSAKEDVDPPPREKEILVSFCRGMSNTAIAEASAVKVVTNSNANCTIQIKPGVDSKQEAVAWVFRNGLLGD